MIDDDAVTTRFLWGKKKGDMIFMIFVYLGCICH
jgi:hypothetical protein